MPTRTVPTPPEIAAKVRAFIDADGVRPTGRRLRLADATISRLAAGLPVHEGTALVIRQRLESLEVATK